MGTSLAIWTVGHSNHTPEIFLGLLASERIDAVVDVRSYPFSRFAPQFNREEIKATLAESGLTYLFMGEELGGRPSRPDHYDAEGHALYGSMAKEPAFQRAIDRLLGGATTHRIALMCSEGQPQECHRRLLVSRVLAQRGATINHVLPDGSLFSEDEASLVQRGGGQAALFDDGESAWRSTQSVSRRRRLSTSSAA
jgi:uncharacterized protein (DUF488 family)